MEKPVPMPHRMKSNATFQPKSLKIEPDLQVSPSKDKIHDDNVSQLAIDYNMHMRNQKRIQDLM